MNRYDPYTDKFLRDTQYDIPSTNLAEVGMDATARTLQGGDGMSIWLKPCPRCGAKNSHAIFSHNEKVTANGRTNYVRLIGIRCDDCGFSVDGYLRTIEAVRKWNALEVAE